MQRPPLPVRVGNYHKIAPTIPQLDLDGDRRLAAVPARFILQNHSANPRDFRVTGMRFKNPHKGGLLVFGGAAANQQLWDPGVPVLLAIAERNPGLGEINRHIRGQSMETEKDIRPITQARQLPIDPPLHLPSRRRCGVASKVPHQGTVSEIGARPKRQAGCANLAGKTVQEPGVIGSAFHLENVDHVECVRRNIDHRQGPLKTLGIRQFRARDPDRLDRSTIHPEARASGPFPRVETIDDYGVVGGGHLHPIRLG